MSQYTEILGLNEQAVNNLADVHFGYANYLAKSQEDLAKSQGDQHEAYVASSYLISALYRSLVKPSDANESFALSADYYFKIGNPFWKIVAVCGQYEKLLFNSDDTKKSNMPSGETKESKTLGSIEEEFPEMIRRTYIALTKGDLITSSPESDFISFPAGRLGIPLRIYINAFNQIADLSRGKLWDPRYDVLSSWTELLNRSVETIQWLQSDQYHWKNLKGGFVPLEPETLASCICLCRYAQYNQINTGSLVENIATSGPLAMLPLTIARQITN